MSLLERCGGTIENCLRWFGELSLFTQFIYISILFGGLFIFLRIVFAIFKFFGLDEF